MEREQRNQDAIEEERTALMKLKEVDTQIPTIEISLPLCSVLGEE